MRASVLLTASWLALFGCTAPVVAGSMAIAWDPVIDADLAGYRVYIGSSPGNYTIVRDVGLATSTTLVRLADCRVHHVAVKAVDASGAVSAAFSNEISGYPRPALFAAAPAVIEQDVTQSVVLNGANFRPGATLRFDEPSIVVLGVSVDSCNQLRANLRVPPSARVGAARVEVKNADGTFGAWAAVLSIAPKAPPRVERVTPPSDSAGVAVTVQPGVTFTRPVQPATLTPATVALLDLRGEPVLQAHGSPTLSADGRTATVVPAADLEPASGYRLRVLGGPRGVRDAGGAEMQADFVQIPGFTTALQAPDPPAIVTVAPADAALGVPASVRPTITFSEPLLSSSVTVATVALLDGAGEPVGQAAESPRVAADGRTVTIVPATVLGAGRVYRVRVTGGASGVKSLANVPLTASLTQAAGFTTAVDTAGPPRIVAVVPASLTTGVPRDVRPVVTFSEPVHPASVTPTTISLLDTAGRPIAQAHGSPILSADGVTATVVLAAQLDFSTIYRVRVLGGSTGVQDLRGTDLSGTYTQASGFTTLDDEVPPLLGAVTAEPAATTVDIVWTTDEPATGRVTYRRDAAVAYQRPVEFDDLATRHAIRLEGLAPSTRYAFYVESVDAAGNVATSADGWFTTTASPHAYLTIEAESARLVAPARGAQGVGAFRGGWVETPPFTSTGKATAPSGRAEMSFFVPQTDTWSVWVRLFGASTSSDAWFESVDGATRRPIAPPARGSWEWVLARSYALTAGRHVLELGGYEAQARADRILITNDPAFVATEQPDLDIVPPDPPQGLIAVPGEGRVALAWTHPPSGAARILVRYRTDGPFPAHPADGLPVALDGELRVTHTGLTNGTTYRYAVFAVDEAGNASAGATVEATPGP